MKFHFKRFRRARPRASRIANAKRFIVLSPGETSWAFLVERRSGQIMVLKKGPFDAPEGTFNRLDGSLSDASRFLSLLSRVCSEFGKEEFRLLVPMRAAKSVIVDFPADMTPGEIASAIGEEAQTRKPWENAEVFVAHETVGEVETSDGRRMRVGAALVPETWLNPYLEAFTEGGYILRAVHFEPEVLLSGFSCDVSMCLVRSGVAEFFVGQKGNASYGRSRELAEGTKVSEELARTLRQYAKNTGVDAPSMIKVFGADLSFGEPFELDEVLTHGIEADLGPAFFERVEKAQRRWPKVLLYLGTGCLLLANLALVILGAQVGKNLSQAQEALKDEQAVFASISAIESDQSRSRELHRTVQARISHLPKVLPAVAEAVPSGVRLKSLSFDSAGMALSGEATSEESFKAAQTALSVYGKVSVERSVKTDDGYEFTLQVGWNKR